jgi:tight adherence protein C
MNLALPISLSLISLALALGPTRYIYKLARVDFKWQRQSLVREKLVHLGKNTETDYENLKIAELSLSIAISILFVLLTLLHVINLFQALVLTLCGFVFSILIFEGNLNRRCKRKLEEMEEEFPAVVELLTLSIGSGESPSRALARIADRSHGHLSSEFKKLKIELDSGISLSVALDLMSKRVEFQAFRRFVDTFIISISRGTPLVETLLHLTGDARNREKSRLMTAAGKSEIRMMIPIVFLILPISILFALYPSMQNLDLFQL